MHPTSSRLATILSLLFAASTTFSHAGIIPVSGAASVTANGSASVPSVYGGQSQSYNLVQGTSVPYASFAGNVAGEAVAEITTLPPFDLYLGTTLRAASSASQVSTISANAISVESDVSADTWAYSQVGGRTAWAQSLTDITFQLDEVSEYELSGFGFHWQSGWPYTSSVFSVSLVSGGGVTVFRYENDGYYAQPLYLAHSGLLAPGTYRFLTDLQAVGGPDPLGEGGRGELSLNLGITRVPEAGPTLLMLVASALVLVFAHRRNRTG